MEKIKDFDHLLEVAQRVASRGVPTTTVGLALVEAIIKKHKEVK